MMKIFRSSCGIAAEQQLDLTGSSGQANYNRQADKSQHCSSDMENRQEAKYSEQL